MKMVKLKINCKIEDYLIIFDESTRKRIVYVTMLIGDTKHSFLKNFEVRTNEKNCCI